MAGPHIVPQALVLMMLGVALVYATAQFLKRYEWNEKTLHHKFSLSAGALTFLIVLAPLQEFDRSRPDNPQGMLLVGIVALVLLVLLRRKLKRLS